MTDERARNKMGRPLTGGAKRTHKLTIQMNDDELAILTADAEATQHQLAALVRIRALEASRRALDAARAPSHAEMTA